MASASPSNPRQLWLGPARVYDGRVWFAAETAPLADAVAEVLSRPAMGSYRVIPNQEVRELWRRVQAGRLPGVAKVCEAPPPPAMLSEVVYGEATRGELEVRCGEKNCRLELVLRSPDHSRQLGRDPARSDSQELARFGMELPRAESPARWAELVRGGNLKREEPPEDGSLMGGLGVLEEPSGNGIVLELRDSVQVGSWTKSPQTLLEPVKAALYACEEQAPVDRDWWVQRFLLGVSPEGRLQTCEFEHPDRLPSPGFACQCEVLRKLDFGSGKTGRRASFALRIKKAETTKAASSHGRPPNFLRVGSFQADDPSAVLGTGALDQEALGRCLAGVSQPAGRYELPLAFLVGADGTVGQVGVSWPGALPGAAADCLQQELLRGQFNCPITGHAKVAAKLELEIRGPAAKR